MFRFHHILTTIIIHSSQFNKEISNGTWRAYSKGTIELCEKYSAFAINGRSTLVDAPKDVRRLEALKPNNIPSMRERYESAVAKEKRLEAATQPARKESNNVTASMGKDTMNKRNRNNQDDIDRDGEIGGGEDEKVKLQKAKKIKKTKKVVVNNEDLNNVDALKEEDEVQEGIVWSDDESE
jgi:hypothetical protein